MKILVTDDSTSNLTMISASLQRLGHSVIEAQNGRDAIEQFQKNKPDLVILDVMMDGMDGYECARKLHEINPNDWIPIIFLSALFDDASIAKGIEAGGDDYLTTPFSDVTLEAKIKAMQRIAEMRAKLNDTTEELRKLASIDKLTGMYNRFQFERSLVERFASAERHHYNMAVLFIDLDHFKTINDTFGHLIGDMLLKEVANRIRNCTRMEDFIARVGGDEFVVIISQIQSESIASDVAKKIIKEIGKIYNIENYTLRISASIGIAHYPNLCSSPASMIQNADMAMYEAKGSGRNKYQNFSEALHDKYKQQLSLEHELKFAIERGQLFVHYQPIYNLLTKKVIGMEALLRWRHIEYGLISPNIFIPIAEETGMIVDIGTWVLRHVCEQGAKWIAEGSKDFKLSINLSLQQFLQEEFLQLIGDILHETKMNPRLLELELTESTVVTYTQNLKSTLKSLYDLGIGIAVDDFGTRYSSLTSLRYLPITTLKIDKEFLKDVSSDPRNSIIVKSLIALGTNLNLNVIAEGIQTDEQLQFLIVNGCIHGQGFLLNKPLPAEKMTLLLQEHMQSKTCIR